MIMAIKHGKLWEIYDSDYLTIYTLSIKGVMMTDDGGGGGWRW